MLKVKTQQIGTLVDFIFYVPPETTYDETIGKGRRERNIKNVLFIFI